MNTQKNVNQRLSKLYTKDTKQELSSEKVELALERVDLALIDGIAKDLDKVGDDWVRAEGILSKFGNEVEAIGKNILNKAENAKQSVDKAESMAKDLGVDIPEISELKKRIAIAERKGKEIVKKAQAAQ